jgi:tetratricopeptide (TPR) repeat protein
MKKTLTLFSILFLSFGLFAQSRINADYNQAFRQAKNYYAQSDYGRAMKYAEDAIRFKKNTIDSEVSKIENSLSSKDVKRAQGKISDIIPILREREENDCIDIINYYMTKEGAEYFHDSIYNLIAHIKTQDEFPEAQKLLGDIYKIEGEYTLAESFYRKALNNFEILDVPDEKYEILYTMADLSRLTGEYEKMELRLLNITGKESFDRRNMILKSALNVISRNNNTSVDKLFELYRYDDYYSLKAYCLLSDYYENAGLTEKAMSFSAIAVITGFTKMEEVIKKRNLDYEYTNLQDFLVEVSHYEDLVEWGTENNIWKSFNNLYNLSKKLGYTKFSTDLLKVLAKDCPEPYYQNTAVLELSRLK